MSKYPQWSEELSHKPFTNALLGRFDAQVREARDWWTQVAGSVRPSATPTQTPATLAAAATEAIAVLAAERVATACERIGLRPHLPGDQPTMHTPFVAAFGLVVLAAMSGVVRAEGVPVDQIEAVALFFTCHYLPHSVGDRLSVADRGTRAFRRLALDDAPQMQIWRQQVTEIAKGYVLQWSTTNPTLKNTDFDWLFAEMFKSCIDAIEPRPRA